MNQIERQVQGAALLAMAEAVVSGRQAGHVTTLTLADTPFDASQQLSQYRAWMRGFYVGRSIDQ